MERKICFRKQTSFLVVSLDDIYERSCRRGEVVSAIVVYEPETLSYRLRFKDGGVAVGVPADDISVLPTPEELQQSNCGCSSFAPLEVGL